MQNTTILKYKLLKKIGEGGFAEVWLGEHEKLNNKVAIKILDTKIVEMDGFKERFLRAAKLLSSLKHPYIVEVIDYDDTDRYVMIMEYLDGPMFREYITKNYNASKPLEFIPLFLQVIEAVGFIHQKGVIHRDIKPTNVIIQQLSDSTLRAKLLDFDIAKDLNSEHTATLTNQQMGTITYMSPEQVLSAKAIDERSDIYSLGVMMFFVLTGKAAYSAQTDSQFKLMEKIVKEPLPDIKTINTNIPDWAVAVVNKATHKQPEMRFQNCQEFRDAILSGMSQKAVTEEEKTVMMDSEKTQFFSKTEPVTQSTAQAEPETPTPEPKKTNSKAILIGLLLAMVITAIGVYFYINHDKKDSVSQVEAVQKDTLTNSLPQNEPDNKKNADNSIINILFGKAKAADSNGDFDTAIDLYKKGISRGDTRPYNNLGVLFAYKKNSPEEAIKYYTLGSEAGDADATNNLGILYYEKGQLKNAETWFLKAYQQDKDKTMKIIRVLRKKTPSFLSDLN